MKRALIPLVLAIPLFAPPAFAQADGKLDQVASMHQFVGEWRNESQDTTWYMDWRPFGDTAFVVTHWYLGPSGERLGEGQRVYGYDPPSGKYVVATVRKGAARATFATLWFTSDHRCELVAHRDPMDLSGSIWRRSVVEFRTPDEWAQINTYVDGQQQDTTIVRRVRR